MITDSRSNFNTFGKNNQLTTWKGERNKIETKTDLFLLFFGFSSLEFLLDVLDQPERHIQIRWLCAAGPMLFQVRPSVYTVNIKELILKYQSR